jgi:hypothetical protein
MWQSILANNHLWPTTFTSHGDDLISCPLCHPVVVAAEIEDQFGCLHITTWNSPDIVAPFVCRYIAHLVSSHIPVTRIEARNCCQFGSFRIPLSAAILSRVNLRNKRKDKQQGKLKMEYTHNACLTPLLLFKKAKVVSVLSPAGSRVTSLIRKRRSASGKTIVRNLTMRLTRRASCGIKYSNSFKSGLDVSYLYVHLHKISRVRRGKPILSISAQQATRLYP